MVGLKHHSFTPALHYSKTCSMMRILVAPDKFKGVLTAREVAENIAAGLREILPDAEIDLAPVADGGEGTAELICSAGDGGWKTCEAHDAFGNSISARYVRLTDGAAMEMCEAAGAKNFPFAKLDPVHANTFGVGEMISAAAHDGAGEIIVGLGGSITNDGGFGMARALGYRFLGGDGREICGAVTELRALQKIEAPKNLVLAPIIGAADVRNPLLGEHGATRVFAPQKGANPGQARELEEAMTKLADIAERDLGICRRDEPGAGAAGGLGFGLMIFCGATLRRGFEVVAEATGLKSRVQQADVVITGEGSLDRQTLDGKAPAEVAKMARSLGKWVYAVVGLREKDFDWRGIFNGVNAVAEGPVTPESIKRAPEMIQAGARRLAKDLAARP